MEMVVHNYFVKGFIASSPENLAEKINAWLQEMACRYIVVDQIRYQTSDSVYSGFSALLTYSYSDPKLIEQRARS